MLRGLCTLLLGAGLLLAQEEEDDGGIVIDEVPPAETEPEKGEAAPAPATARPPRAPGKRPATVEVERGPFTLELPDDWVLEKIDVAAAELGWDVLLPGSTSGARLLIVRQENLGDPRAAPYYYRDSVLKQQPGATAEPRPSPVPRLVVRGDGAEVLLYLFPSFRNQPYFLEFRCAAADAEQAEADLVAAAKTFTADVPAFPPIPEGYGTSTLGPWLIARSPAVKGSLRTLEKVLREEEKRFRKFHGALPRTDAPLVVLVHASTAEAAKIEPRVSEALDGFLVSDRRRTLFALPVDKNDIEKQGLLAGAAHGLLFVARYGDPRPWWVYVGEQSLARAEWMTGRPLPDLHEGFVTWADNLTLHRCDEMQEQVASGADGWTKESFFYACMFHAGKYKKEYRAFLDDFAKTGDGPGSFARHVESIDPEKLKAATNDYIYKKIRPVKPK